MINILELYKAVNSTREFIELDLDKEDFDQLVLTDDVQAKLTLMRLDEGISMLIDELNTKVKVDCVRCGKEVSVPLTTSGGEWLFYEKEPRDMDDQNEFLLIDKDKFEIDPISPLRQELLLAMPEAPHCKKECKKFEESGTGVKALAGLKDLMKGSE